MAQVDKSNESKKVKKLIELFYKIRGTSLKKDKIKLIESFKYQKTLKKILNIICDYTSPIFYNGFKVTKHSKELNAADSRLNKVLSILEKLSNKEINKVKADSILDSIFVAKKLTWDELELYNRIFAKDLQLGIDDVDIKKLFPSVVKYPVKFMFPGKYEPGTNLKFPVMVEPLISGERVKLTAYPDGKVCAFSLNLVNYKLVFSHQLKILKSLAEKKDRTLEVDAIAFYSSINDTMNLLSYHKNTIFTGKSAVKAAQEKLQLFVFDFLIKGKEHLPLKKRKMMASEFVSRCKKCTMKTTLMPHLMVTSLSRLDKAYQGAIKKKYEGIILKDIKSPYVFGKDSYWLTYKNIELDSGTILEVLPNKLGTTCGSIIVKLDNGKKKNITILREVHKEFLWNKRNEIIGIKCDLKIVPCSWNPLQKSVEFVKLRIEKGTWR